MATIPFTVDPTEVDIEATRAQGAGGQNVNKVSNAVHLRFDVRRSSLPDALKTRVLALADQRLTADGVIVIKAQTSRSLEKNRAEAMTRLEEILARAAHIPRERRATKPSKAAKKRRIESKVKRGEVKAQRRRVTE